MDYSYGYDFTRIAESDLSDIVSYIAIKLSNPKAASDWMDMLQKKIDETRLFPESGGLVDNDLITIGGVRRKLVGSYIMYYLPDADAHMIHILRIIYGQRFLDEIVQELPTV